MQLRKLVLLEACFYVFVAVSRRITSNRIFLILQDKVNPTILSKIFHLFSCLDPYNREGKKPAKLCRDMMYANYLVEKK